MAFLLLVLNTGCAQRETLGKRQAQKDNNFQIHPREVNIVCHNVSRNILVLPPHAVYLHLRRIQGKHGIDQFNFFQSAEYLLPQCPYLYLITID